MGRPFSTEIGLLKGAYEWAQSLDVSVVAEALADALNQPLFAVGSGGSLSAAHYAAFMHQLASGMPSKAITPMEVMTCECLRGIAVSVYSAAGRNPDIISAYKHVQKVEPDVTTTLCFRADSPLSGLSAKHERTSGLIANGNWGTEGFLAVNSLMAFFVLIARAYASLGFAEAEPPAFSALPDSRTAQHSSHPDSWLDALQRSTILVLYGPSTMPAAIDLESKFAEAALGNVQLADYRNFAHGRHHWLAKRADQTSIVAFITPADESIAERTLKLLPRQTAKLRLRISASPALASLVALPLVFRAVECAGQIRGIDPGRPGVPSFGRSIYNLKGFRAPQASKLTARQAVLRKIGKSELISPSEQRQWYEAATRFCHRLQKVNLGAVVLDCDGTICGKAERFGPLLDAMYAALNDLLDRGLQIGVATGRGKSVRKQLLHGIERRFWDAVVVGYYNGADIRTLSDKAGPDIDLPAPPDLQQLKERLETAALWGGKIKVTLRPSQLTIEPVQPVGVKRLWEAVYDLAKNEIRQNAVSVLHSTHSVDVVRTGVSKANVIQAVKERIGPNKQVLCIGDLGRWPGNDFELLSTEYSLSCDQTSSDPGTCWNLAPPGVQGVKATLFCLKHLRASLGAGRLRLPPLLKGA